MSRPPSPLASLLAVSSLASACSGPQSALAPASFGADWIADIFWLMTAAALVIWIIVILLTVNAARREPDHRDAQRSGFLIIGAGAIVPTLALALLLIYGLAPIPVLLAPAPPGSLQIDVSGEQWWWRVRYRPSGGEAVALANKFAFPSARRCNLICTVPTSSTRFGFPLWAARST